MRRTVMCICRCQLGPEVADLHEWQRLESISVRWYYVGFHARWFQFHLIDSHPIALAWHCSGVPITCVPTSWQSSTAASYQSASARVTCSMTNCNPLTRVVGGALRRIGMMRSLKLQAVQLCNDGLNLIIILQFCEQRAPISFILPASAPPAFLNSSCLTRAALLN